MDKAVFNHLLDIFLVFVQIEVQLDLFHHLFAREFAIVPSLVGKLF
jgi:hypothetical protein